MHDPPDPKRSEADAALEREILKGRKFSLAEAIGRLAGPGAMKGASPVARKQQAEMEIDTYVKAHLADSQGALGVVLSRRVKESDLLLQQFEQPLAALAAFVQRLLASDARLHELVREADVEWGHVFGERPHFEQGGQPPDAADPYVVTSVRASLSRLLEHLATAPK